MPIPSLLVVWSHLLSQDHLWAFSAGGYQEMLPESAHWYPQSMATLVISSCFPDSHIRPTSQTGLSDPEGKSAL